MSKSKNIAYTGNYTPHDPVDADGTILDNRTGLRVSPPSRTQQEFRDQCDIHQIMHQYKRTGIIEHINRNAAQGAYLDLPPDLDYQQAMNTVLAGQAAFESLPSTLRTRFNNDVSQFLAYMADPAHHDEHVSLGLKKAKNLPTESKSVGGVQGGSPPPAPSSTEPR